MRSLDPTTVRPEQAGDVAAMDQVLRAAFGTEEQVRLVRVLRENGHITLSLVAELRHGRVAGRPNKLFGNRFGAD